MKSIILRNNKKRYCKILITPDKKYFVKKYKDKISNIENLVKEEYKKGIELNSLINYPKPLSFEGRMIIYEFLDINFSLYDLLNKGIFNYDLLKEAAITLRKIHERHFIHGDFNTVNLVITKDNKLYFIDASFSEYNNENKVFFEDFNIYQDISLLLFFIKWIRPLRPWFLLQRVQIKIAIQHFLYHYFKASEFKFDPNRNALMENRFSKGYLIYVKRNKRFFSKISWILLMKFSILINRWKYGA